MQELEGNGARTKTRIVWSKEQNETYNAFLILVDIACEVDEDFFKLGWLESR